MFSGYECISNAFREQGHECFTIDWDERFPSSMHCDISKLQLEDLPEEWRHPDVVFAGTDCTSYSVAAISKHRRKNPITGNLDPISNYAKFCDDVNQHVLNLIKELNPKLYFIENPRGGLCNMTWMKEYPKHLVTYCQYGYPYMKPTHIFTNHPDPQFKHCKNGDPCHERAPRGTKQGLQKIKKVSDRSTIPPLLCDHIVDISEEYILGKSPNKTQK